VATRRQKIEVGVFLTAALVIAIIVIGALVGVHRSDLVHYRIEFTENVAGLSEGSRVTYMGVPVGKVTDIRITPDNVVSVQIGIEERKLRLRKDVQAKCTYESVFGPVIIDLFYPADRHQELLRPGSLIPAQLSLRERIETEIPKTLEKLATVMARIDNTLAAIEPASIAATIDDLRSAVKQFDATLGEIKPQDVSKLVHDLNKLLTSTQAALTELRGQTRDLTTSIQEAIKDGSSDVAGTSKKIGESLDKLQQATARISTLVEDVTKIVEANRKTVADSLTHARNILEKADKQLDGMDLPATDKALRQAAGDVGSAAKTVARSREDFRQSLDNVEVSVTRALDELERTLASARRLIDYLERDPSAVIRGKTAPEPR
jgi:phospholipid/cholesterol/gamma-HCH transport system substrate-binding protein